MEKIYILEKSVQNQEPLNTFRYYKTRDSKREPVKAFRDYSEARVECDRLNYEMTALMNRFIWIDDTRAISKEIDFISNCIYTQEFPEECSGPPEPHSNNSMSKTGIDEDHQHLFIANLKKDPESYIAKAQAVCPGKKTNFWNKVKTYLEFTNIAGNAYAELPVYYVNETPIELI